MAALPCGFGAADLAFVLHLRAGDWAKDVPGTVLLLAVAAAACYGGWVLWRRTNRLRRVRVVASDGGLTYQDWTGCVSCRWDQIDDVRWSASDHYDVSSLALYGVAKVPGTTTREFSHTTHQITVLRSDGVKLVFTEELENVVGLGSVIMECVDRSRRGR